MHLKQFNLLVHFMNTLRAINISLPTQNKPIFELFYT